MKGCALAIAYKSDVHDVQPDDFTIFSVNHTCVWYQNTAFNVPSLPACPEGGCHCAWFWIHSVRPAASPPKQSVADVVRFPRLIAVPNKVRPRRPGGGEALRVTDKISTLR